MEEDVSDAEQEQAEEESIDGSESLTVCGGEDDGRTTAEAVCGEESGTWWRCGVGDAMTGEKKQKDGRRDSGVRAECRLNCR